MKDAYSTLKNLRKSSQQNASFIANADRTLLADIAAILSQINAYTAARYLTT
ncbi:hypothetical protein DPMN_057253 [Dreissena polymorpha]|uniref:Uncharacterized protein n=1 Tax=Dreissena polymorpha TaxID=45954 RepID=A0A9D4HUC7_DREPO|nr:hypothetical protein DPMN_057253 [Dreissena polymorpha]